MCSQTTDTFDIFPSKRYQTNHRVVRLEQPVPWFICIPFNWDDLSSVRVVFSHGMENADVKFNRNHKSIYNATNGTDYKNPDFGRALDIMGKGVVLVLLQGLNNPISGTYFTFNLSICKIVIST